MLYVLSYNSTTVPVWSILKLYLRRNLKYRTLSLNRNSRMRVFLRVFARYKAQMDKKPMFTQIATCGVMVTAGDVIAQTIIERKTKYDFRRTAIMSLCGFSYFGPVIGAWFMALKRWRLSAMACVALDQICAAPCVLAGFFTIQSLLNGKTLDASLDRVCTELPSVLVMNWAVWVPVQCTNFYFVPFQYRMLYLQSVALFWNCYLSTKANRVPEQHQPVFPVEE